MLEHKSEFEHRWQLVQESFYSGTSDENVVFACHCGDTKVVKRIIHD